MSLMQRLGQAEQRTPGGSTPCHLRIGGMAEARSFPISYSAQFVFLSKAHHVDVCSVLLNHHRLLVLSKHLSHGVRDFADGGVSLGGGENVRHEIRAGTGSLFDLP
jgi:hypothetical protein